MSPPRRPGGAPRPIGWQRCSNPAAAVPARTRPGERGRASPPLQSGSASTPPPRPPREPRRPPECHIADWPDFTHRGVLLDVSRDKVPTMETLFDLVDLLASWKINQVQLYMEHTFAYRGHEVVWQHASPLTGDEIEALDTFCGNRYVGLVPNQNSLGHMHRWLIHEPYRRLAECPEGLVHP